MAQNTISDELNRLIQAKADIKTALESKGVTIGDSSTLDEYPALIEDMPSGGGGIDTSTIIDLIEGDASTFEIPYGTTKIRQYAFYNCTELTDVSIPNTVTRIENNAFDYCNKLKDVQLPNTITYLGQRAFASTSAFRKIIVPDSVITLETGVFNENPNVRLLVLGSGVQSCGQYIVTSYPATSANLNIISLAETPPTISTNSLKPSFGSSGRQKIYVHNTDVDAYKNAWTMYSSVIYPLASATFESSTNTVQASGRDTLELYIDSSLIDSNVYTFTPGAADTSHNIMVKSVDPSYGILDTYNLEILVEGNAPTYYATAPTFTVEAPTYEYYYDEEGAVNLKLYVDISTGQLEGYQGQYSTSVNCTNYTGNMSANSRTDSIRQQFSRGTYFDDPETGPFTFGFTTEVYYKDENQNLLYTAGPATFSDTVTPEWNIPERQEPIYINIEANEYSDTEWVINLSTDSDGDFVVDMRSQNSEAIPEEIYNDEVIQNNAGRAEIILERPLYGEYGGAGKTYNIDVYTKGTESFTRSNENRKSINVEEQRPDPLAAPTIEITSERNDRFMTITNNDEHADQIYYSIYRDGDYVETNTLFTDQVQVNIGDRIEAYAHDSNNVYPDSEPDSVEVE